MSNVEQRGASMRTVQREGDELLLIDQRRLPERLEVLRLTEASQVAEAIRSLAVRGAPAIGVAAAYGLWLGAARALERLGAGWSDETAFWDVLERVAAELRGTRPTAVNLFWALERAMAAGRRAGEAGADPAGVVQAIRHEADRLAEEDVASNRRLAELGAGFIGDGDGVLTHCNTGALATVDVGTALGAIVQAHRDGKRIRVYVDETRPVLQGARLTAWECCRAGVPAVLITDNMAAHFMRQGKIQSVFVGADRIARNGDTANKIGTYGLAVLARHHGIPFYVVAPWSTVDRDLADGREIAIEERRPEEVTHVGGVRIAPEGIEVANPAFDVTPAELIAAIVTDRGIARPPYASSLAVLERVAPRDQADAMGPAPPYRRGALAQSGQANDTRA